MSDHESIPSQTLTVRGECRCRAPSDQHGRRPVGRLGCTCVPVPLGDNDLLSLVWNDLSLLDRRVIRARSAALFAAAGDVETEREALRAAYEGFPDDVVRAHREREAREQLQDLETISAGPRREWHAARLNALYGDVLGQVAA